MGPSNDEALKDFDAAISRAWPRTSSVRTEIRQRARTLAEQTEERGVTTGVHPAGFAAACLYKAGQEHGKGGDAK